MTREQAGPTPTQKTARTKAQDHEEIGMASPDFQDTISGEVDWQKKSYALTAGSRTLKWVYSKDSSGDAGEDCGWVDALTVGTDSLTAAPGAFGEALDCDLKFTTVGDSLWYTTPSVNTEYYYDGDAVEAGDFSDGKEAWLQTIVDIDSSETLKFYWKVSSQANHDYLEFYIDDVRQDRISGNVDWQQKSYAISSGIHILKWCYTKDGSGSSGEDTGWVDFVQWTGPSPDQNPQQWGEITYKHDVHGRRSEKKIDGYSTRYVYDGPHIIAEYDGNNNLLRKYVYGPGIDQPVCMIEVADSNATYYYHHDGLGSIVALSDSNGDTVQTYEYSIFGEVAVEDANHTNPYMFAGRRYDIEIGLYYNRARYYNPFTGRFLQTDPAGYKDGMNLYAYCGNNPVGFIDPMGLLRYGVTITWEIKGKNIYPSVCYEELNEDSDVGDYDFILECDKEEDVNEVLYAFFGLAKLQTGRALIDDLRGKNITIKAGKGKEDRYDHKNNVITFDPYKRGWYDDGSEDWLKKETTKPWMPVPDFIRLGHELIHARQILVEGLDPNDSFLEWKCIGMNEYADLPFTENQLRKEAGIKHMRPTFLP